MRNLSFLLLKACTGLVFFTLISACSGAGAGKDKAAASGKEFRDCKNCPVMVKVPAGSFTMGTPVEDELRFGMPETLTGRSVPLQEITFEEGFAIAKYPVTVAQFREFVQESGYDAPGACFTQHEVDGHWIYEEVPGYSWRAPGFPQGENHPVVCVNAEDGQAYADWLSEKTGHNYSLPNEAQFEYAARAGTDTAFFWGDVQDARACEYSNQPDLTQARVLDIPAGPEYRFQCEDGYAWTSPVDTYKPNPWGLHDMLGNVWEWTADCWHDNLEGWPADGSTRTDGDCDGRSSRGGSYGNAVFSTYVGVRAPRHATYVGHSWGFRVVRTD